MANQSLIGIIADDLTGAADAVAPFAMRGMRCVVQWRDSGRPGEMTVNSQVLSISTDTRDCDPDQAPSISEFVGYAVKSMVLHGPQVLYKKIDSTLRGHLRVELDAMQRSAGSRIAIICPSFPANGRVVVDGSLLVSDRPARSVRAAFEQSIDTRASDLRLGVIRGSAEALATEFTKLAGSGSRSIFCDAETDEDLDRIAVAITGISSEVIAVGSAGLSAAIARQMLPSKTIPRESIQLPAAFRSGRVLVIVGSRHPVARSQAARLASLANVQPIILDRPGSALAIDIAARFARGDRVVVLVSPEDDSDGCQLPDVKNNDLMTVLASGVGMLITGGATAKDVFGLLGRSMSLEIGGETEPGIVFGVLRSGSAGKSKHQLPESGLPVIVKSGGFGDRETLARCVGLFA